VSRFVALARPCDAMSSMPRFVAWLGVCLFAPAIAHAQDDPIAYVRCPRTTETLTLDSGTTFLGLDIDVLPDVSQFFSGFNAPCDLVLRAPDGTEEILYDCTTTSTDEAGCAAMDPAVSFDGERIAFTVFRGPLVPGSMNFSIAAGGDDAYHDLPSRQLAATEAQLAIVDVTTGEITELQHVEGTFDAGPAWLPDGRLAFTSSRDGNHSTLVFGTNSTRLGSRIYAVDPDGRNLDLASHHGLSQDQHPLVLQDGRVAYSSWQIFGGQTFRYTNGSPGGFGTIGNSFHIYVQAPDGAAPFAFYGQHCGDHSPITGAVDHKAAHFLAQTGDGRVWFTDYYRGNNNGLGHVVGMMSEPEGQEGKLEPEGPLADLYAPRDIVSAATWSSSADQFAQPMPAPEVHHPDYADPIVFAGKLGHATALPGGGLALVWGKGACSTVAHNTIFEALGLPVPPATSGSGQGVASNVFTQLALDTPACDAGIYATTTIPSTHPSDLAVVVDSAAWHEIMPRAVVPYAEIHGIERPAVIPRADTAVSRPELPVGTPFGLLGAASIIDRETHPVGGIHFVGEHQFHLQGTDTIEYDDDDLCGVRILGVQPNRGDNVYQQIANVAGERLVILGEIGVRNRADGVELLDPSGKPDTSFLLRMPANVPYMMQGIDCDGRTLNTDQSWQSVRPGEMKTCGGCHVHSRESDVSFEETFAATSEYAVVLLGEGKVPLLAGATADGPAVREVDGMALQIDFEHDIMPIFAARCTSCHGGDAPAAALALDRPGTEEGSSWQCLVADRGQTCVPEAQRMATTDGTTFRRPQLTRYVRAFNALGSSLYWKAANERTDGNTDDTFDAASDPEDRDLDFGADHPTEITPEELGLLGRWIDIGSPGGPAERDDTQRPTLTLAATYEGDTVTHLQVGTVDVPSGIDVGSLIVCILDESGACTTMLAEGGAMDHDVLEIPVAGGLSDPDVEVLARVRDVAGNETEIRRTVRWLLDSPLPPDPGGTDTGADDSGSASGDEGATSPATADDDGSEGSDSAGASSNDGNGCGCRMRSTTPWESALVWLVVLAWRRRQAAKNSRALAE
jgi:hypothetical protein